MRKKKNKTSTAPTMHIAHISKTPLCPQRRLMTPLWRRGAEADFESALTVGKLEVSFGCVKVPRVQHSPLDGS